ncbi:MAG: DMT family transporter [Rhodobacteraceae bacterium]|nr:DMT family transporter [Paracoccaceae bacterium]
MSTHAALSETPVQTLKAAAWMIGAVFAFSSMAVAGRAVSFELDTFEIMMFRSFVGIAIVLAVGSAAGTLGQISTRSFHIHVIRNISHFTGQNLWFFAITVAPLAQVFALEFTMPIWAMFLAIFVLGEALTRVRLAVAAIGITGIMVITQPWSGSLGAGVAPAALSAIGFAGSAVFTRLLTRTESITCILFWLTAMQALLGIICAGYDGDIALPSAESWPWIALIGAAGLLAHFCLTTALSLAPAAVVVPVDFSRMPLIAVVGMLFYGEPLEAAVLVGAALIFGANYMNILAETRGRKRNT